MEEPLCCHVPAGWVLAGQVPRIGGRFGSTLGRPGPADFPTPCSRVGTAQAATLFFQDPCPAAAADTTISQSLLQQPSTTIPSPASTFKGTNLLATCRKTNDPGIAYRLQQSAYPSLATVTATWSKMGSDLRLPQLFTRDEPAHLVSYTPLGFQPR